MARGHARHENGLREADLGHPVTGVRTGETGVARPDHLDSLHHLSETLLQFAVDHPIS